MYSSLSLSEFYDLTNTKYFIAREQGRPDQIIRYTSPTGISVFENPNARPRAWMTYTNEFVSDASGETAGLERVEGCENVGAVSETAWTIQTTSLEIETDCDGYLVLADPYFVGWIATVDGVNTPIRRYRNGLRAVYVPAGESTVEFRYEPNSVVWGAWFTGFGFLLCIGAGAWLRFGSSHD